MNADEIAREFPIEDRALAELMARAAANGRETEINVARRLERVPEGERGQALGPF